MPSALRSEARPHATTAWRAVERQSGFATMKLVNSADEQLVLEQALDRAKPRYAPGTEHLHYLLKTPFRYKPDDRYGSRFSRPASRGLFYAAEQDRTALCEAAFYHMLWLCGPLMAIAPPRLKTYTVFSVAVAAPLALDLIQPPFLARRADWTDREAVAACQALGMAAQDEGIDLIRYSSVRDPEEGAALALLTPCFAAPHPLGETTWHLSLLPDELSLRRDDRGDAFTLDYGWYMQDSRLAGLPAALGFALRDSGA